ncbi:MAG: tetratricopeptide repeat protein [Vicinamibacterales bacterium]|jgi:tetratricopeptide (TPR) repeat protein|nr:tetratricopeptide repeat protein [Vicinamibacterales bacterium]
MRRSERHHLKENTFAVAIGSLWEQLQGRGRVLTMGVAIGLGLLIAYGSYSWWTGRTESQAGALLAEALVLADAPVVPPPPPPPPAPVQDAAEDPDSTAEPVETSEAVPPVEPVEFVQPPGTYATIEEKFAAALPKLIAAADAYPNTQSSITARYRAAAALAALGRQDEAAAQYQQVIEREGAGVYGRMARLGLAGVELARGAYDEAIALLEQSSGVDAEADLPVDGVLMRLGQAYALAGRPGEARATFQRVMDEFPFSIYFADAEREFQALDTDS